MYAATRSPRTELKEALSMAHGWAVSRKKQMDMEVLPNWSPALLMGEGKGGPASPDM